MHSGSPFRENEQNVLKFTKFGEIPTFSLFSHFSAPGCFWALGPPHAHPFSEDSGPGSSSPDGVHGRARANQRGYSTRSRLASDPPHSNNSKSLIITGTQSTASHWKPLETLENIWEPERLKTGTANIKDPCNGLSKSATLVTSGSKWVCGAGKLWRGPARAG